MKKYICLISAGLDEQTEAAIAPYDMEGAQIELYAGLQEAGFSPEQIPVLLLELGYGEAETEWFFMSDMSNLCCFAKRFFGGLFEQVIDISPQDKESTELPMTFLYHKLSELAAEQADACSLTMQDFKELDETLTGLVRSFLPEEAFENYLHLQEMKRVEEQREAYGEIKFLFLLAAFHSLLENMPEIDTKRKLAGNAFLARLTGESFFLELFQRIAYESPDLTTENRYFLWRQSRRMILLDKKLHDSKGIQNLLYRKVYESFDRRFEGQLEEIPFEERTKDCYFVFTLQFLTARHAPTKTALERIYTLGKVLGKQVYVFNLREQLSEVGLIPVYGAENGNIISDYDDMTQITYQGFPFFFYQCKNPMPNDWEVSEILRVIRQVKPSAILTIGSDSITSDLAANLVPVINIPVVFTSMVRRPNQLTVVGRELQQEDIRLLLSEGCSADNVIESTFTFELRPQTQHLKRADFGIPEDGFVLLTVGIRLDADVDEAFVQAMLPVLEEGAFLVFAGVFERYESWCRQYPILKQNSVFIGYQKDILAVNEICDLYVNPRRFGGGFSITEAFAKGKPGVTIAYGDVAATAGPDFCVEDYTQMQEWINRYRTDDAFYKAQSEKAQVRFIKLTDSAAALSHILQEAGGRSLFRKQGPTVIPCTDCYVPSREYLILVKFHAGLGNQMFQYALYRKLKSMGKRVMADLTNYIPECKGRPFGLDIFPVSLDPVTDETLEDETIHGLLLEAKEYPVREKQNMHYDAQILDLECAYLYGLFQTERYFRDIREELLREFVFPAAEDESLAALGEALAQENSVAIHVRRGDYLSDSHIRTLGNVCDEAYYERAAAALRERFPGLVFYVFTNDTAWVKNCPAFAGMQVMDTYTEAEGWKDMYLMSCCRHHIIANSSFSWWAAWLNENPDQVVIAPKVWIRGQDTPDIWCREWIRL